MNQMIECVTKSFLVIETRTIICKMHFYFEEIKPIRNLSRFQCKKYVYMQDGIFKTCDLFYTNDTMIFLISGGWEGA